jgi:hypothetical protein
VAGVAPGDRVMPHFMQSCGTCRNCVRGQEKIGLDAGVLGVTTWGTHAEHVKARALGADAVLDDATDDIPAAVMVLTGGSTPAASWAAPPRPACAPRWSTASSTTSSASCPEEAIHDRVGIAHRINLFDMNRSHADVLPVAGVLAYLGGVGAARDAA